MSQEFKEINCENRQRKLALKKKPCKFSSEFSRYNYKGDFRLEDSDKDCDLPAFLKDSKETWRSEYRQVKNYWGDGSKRGSGRGKNKGKVGVKLGYKLDGKNTSEVYVVDNLKKKKPFEKQEPKNPCVICMVNPSGRGRKFYKKCNHGSQICSVCIRHETLRKKCPVCRVERPYGDEEPKLPKSTILLIEALEE
jgi:hypothetical protein